MPLLPVQITRYADAHFPGWVECVFVDAAGHRHVFDEKVPYVSLEHLHEGSSYPCEGSTACDIVREWIDEQGRSLVHIRTILWHDDDGFIVLASQVVDDSPP